jgi:hypothetical protein
MHMMVPCTNVRRRFSGDTTDTAGREIDWITPPKHDHKVMFTVLTSAPHILEDSWKTVCRPGDATLGSLALSNGESAWLMTRWESMSHYDPEHAKRFADTMRIDSESNPGEVFANVRFVSQWAGVVWRL